MAKTPAERQRARRQRIKERRKEAPEISRQHLSDEDFSAFMAADECDWSDRTGLIFDSEALKVPGWDADDFPARLQTEFEEALSMPYPGTLGRAEITVGLLIETAQVLAASINGFKLSRIDAAIKRLETELPSNPDEMRQALAEVVHLQEMKRRLSKEVRFSMPAYEVKGD